MHSRHSYILALIAMALSGIAVTLSFAPYNWWPLGLAATVILNLALDKTHPRRAFMLGWAYGAGLFGSGVSWVYISMHTYGYTPAPLALFLTLTFCLLLGLMPAFTAMTYCRWVRNGRAGRILGFAALWLLCEWVRVWLFTGFPWLYVGYAYLDTPLSGWAPVGGIFLLSLMVYLSGACVSQALLTQRQANKRWTLIAAPLALWLLGWSLQTVNWTQATGNVLKVAIVQADITQDQKWLPENYGPTLQLYDEMTQTAIGKNDVVIWPEAAIPNYYHRAKEYLDLVANMAEQENTALVLGIPYRTPEGVFNGLAVLTGGSGIYAKQKLVPFGEYIPLESLLNRLLELIDLPMSSFSRGPAGQLPLQIKGMSAAPFICYEVVYPDLVAQSAGQTDFILTVSNDAWFGHSIGPKQNFQMARMRALETGRQMVRSTSTGITAIIDQTGKVRARLPSFERGILSAPVESFSGQTPYVRFGSWPTVLLCFVLVLVARPSLKSSRK